MQNRQDLRDEYSEAEKKNYQKLSLEELLEKIKNDQYGNYYNIRYIIAEKGNLHKIGPTFREILSKRGISRNKCKCRLFGGNEERNSSKCTSEVSKLHSK